MSDIDFYITKFDPQTQERLMHIRFTALGIFEDVEEKLYHRMPSFFKNGKDVLLYASYKKHISICQGYDLTDLLKRKYPQYAYTKATIQLPHDESFPYELVKEICELAWERGSKW